jgi:hypothetical protein
LPVGSRVAFHIGESSGEDDDDPNVATGDGRAPPQGSTEPRSWPRWWGTSDGRGGARGDQACGCMVVLVGRAAGPQGCRVVSVILLP